MQKVGIGCGGAVGLTFLAVAVAAIAGDNGKDSFEEGYKKGANQGAPPAATATPSKSAVPTTVIQGTITLQDKGVVYSPHIKNTPANGCVGLDVNEDLHQNTQVTIYDKTGAIAGLTTLGAGVREFKSGLVVSDMADTCVFPVLPVQVPAGSGIYQIVVGVESAHGRYAVTEGQPIAAFIGDVT
ncbi:hypothetical protein ACFXPT_11650 [Streptomyces goshikiensis]|uniref:hypothetical protein n=1 Tax=Streptomyces goshikiensis TaxID=1942 RepID=UPI003697AA18